ncbi:MAG: hypothetical protein FJ110_03715 [Deltaproteobacteria bacterium]|nr:hypothetical protein [Deltaproteobacteria bacterium]
MVFIQKPFIMIIVTLLFFFGCAGTKTEQKSEEKLPPPIEEKVEQPKKEETPLPQAAPDIPAKPSPPPAQPTLAESPKVTPSTQPSPSLTSPIRTTKIAWDSVNLRGGPGTNYKVIGNVKKGTPLSVFEEKGSWLRVRLQDGSEAWVIKAATSEAPKPSPAMTSKPKPM